MFGVAIDITSPTAAMIPKIAKVGFVITSLYTLLYRKVSTINSDKRSRIIWIVYSHEEIKYIFY